MDERNDGRDGARRQVRVIFHEVTKWGEEEQRAWRDYIESHELLTEDDELGLGSEDELGAVRERALDKKLPLETRKHALLVLAHHRTERACHEIARYLETPDPALETFAWLAMEEAVQWIRSRPDAARGAGKPVGRRSRRSDA